MYGWACKIRSDSKICKNPLMSSFEKIFYSLSFNSNYYTIPFNVLMKLFILPFTVLILISLTFSSCKKDKVEEGETTQLPTPSPSSTLNLTLDNKTYTLKVIGQSFKLGDTTKLMIDATSAEFTVRIRANSVQHVSGVGQYYLPCCSNDFYDKTTSVPKHWEMDQRGTTQDGVVTITKTDAKGYEGTYTLYSNDSSVSPSVKKEFKGSFVVFY